MPRAVRLCWPTLILWLVCAAPAVRAHPLIEDALDAVVSPQKLSIELRVAPEQVQVEAGAPAVQSPSAEKRRAHAAYVAKHLRVEADGQLLAPSVVEAIGTPGAGPLIPYHLEYALPRPPQVVRLEHTLLADHDPWTVSCVLRFRQNNQPAFETGLLNRGQTAEFGCDWSAATPGSSPPATTAGAPRAWPTFRAYAAHGVMHILTGYDHLLFVGALVLAASSLWDLVKVVTAFTVAHSLTLTLAILGLVHLSERIVEPMIAASIVLVALQNVFWPEASRGWTRIAVAFGFGLFHGLGFAGGLRDAMTDMPRVGLILALVGFSLGVELGHQTVVLPLFGTLAAARRQRALSGNVALCYRGASAAICLGGLFFLFEALR